MKLARLAYALYWLARGFLFGHHLGYIPLGKVAPVTAETASIICDECKQASEFGVNVGVLVFCQGCFDQLQCEAAGLVCEDCRTAKVCAYKRRRFNDYLVLQEHRPDLIEVGA